MNKKSLIFCFLLLVQFAVMSQNNFAPIGSNWKIQQWVDSGEANSHTCETTQCPGNFIQLVTTDTIPIQEVICSVIKIYSGPSKNELSFTGDSIIVHESSNGLFFFEDNQFYLMVNFNLQIGDTLNFFAPSIFEKISLQDLGIISGQNPRVYKSRAIVENVEVLNIDGQDRKLITYVQGNLMESDSVVLNYSLEGIGNLGGFFGESSIVIADGCHGQFICYEDANFKYSSHENCECIFPDFISSNDNLLKDEFQVYPNPVSNVLSIKTFNDAIINQITIFDITGQKVVQQNNGVDINISSLEGGVYYITGLLGEKIFKTKFIKL